MFPSDFCIPESDGFPAYVRAQRYLANREHIQLRLSTLPTPLTQ